MTITLQTESRDAKANLEALRAEGKVPAVYYGAGAESTSITINEFDFRKLYREAGESNIITLKTENGDIDALVHDYQRDAATNRIMHVDFKLVQAGQSVTVNVAIDFIGESPIEKTGQGTVTKVMQEIEIEALPKNLPEGDIVVDLGVLDAMDSKITIADLNLPEGVTATADAEEAVATIVGIKEETEEEAATEIDFSQIASETGNKTDEE